MAEPVVELLPGVDTPAAAAMTATTPGAVIDWQRLDPAAREALRHARAPSTLKAYREDWQ